MAKPWSPIGFTLNLEKGIIMSYIDDNKLAWEEAFENRYPGWGENVADKLANQYLPFFSQDMIDELKALNLQGKTIAQFACNNGRELLSAMQLGPEYGYGFDIAENFLNQGREIAEKIGRKNVEFVAGNLLDIDKKYNNTFDLIFFTIGAIPWFENLCDLFSVVLRCLKPGGKLLIQDFHPFVDMLLMPGEEGYDPLNKLKMGYSYFRSEPWIENKGMGYISPQYQSKTFTSFTHTLSAIINSLIKSGITIRKFNEYDYDLGMIDELDGKGFPLSFILMAEKPSSEGDLLPS